MRNQIISIIIVSFMRYYFDTSLLILSRHHGGGVSLIASVFIFASACFYSTKLKVCPELKNNWLIAFIEATIGIAIIEFMMGLWCSVEDVISKIVKCGLIGNVETAQESLFTDMLIMGLAACVLLTALIDGQVVEKVMAYFNRQRASQCIPPKSFPTRHRDPNCPFHGDNFHGNNKRGFFFKSTVENR